MESEWSTPLFTVGQEIANFLISCGILSKAWEEARLANNSESYTLNECEGVAYVAFPSFQRIEDFILNESQCGEGNILTDHKFFSGCLKGYDDKPAFIHPGALTLFLHIMEKTDFQAKLHIYTDSKQTKLKPIIFVGHSMGGAVATLATLWVLGKRVRQSSPFCITFGCPLLGDERLVQAVDREYWGCNFCHVVSRHDIVPRMLLAPTESIAKPFTTIFGYWQGINVPDSLIIQDACKTLLNQIFVSPSSSYRPFGTYMLCSSNGAACIQNAQTVLEMLSLTMRSQQTSFDEIVQACLSEHIRYDSVLEEVMQNSIRGIRSIENSNSESPCEMGILLQLEAIGVGAQDDHGQRALRKVENAYDQIDDPHLLIQLSQKKATLAELEWYKEFCEKDGDITYYDSFKNQNRRIDINLRLHRVKLAKFWDEIVEMCEGHELPRDSKTQNKWINAGTTYRRLAEPLDIAYYYFTNRNGNYLSDGRPRRHKVLQQWMEAKEKTSSSRVQGRRTKPASLTQDSCFWAHVEEVLKDLKSLKEGEKHRLQNLEKFEEYVTRMVKAFSISLDVFFRGSSFMMWWEEWKEYNKAQSPEWSSRLYEIMESESPLKFERIDSLTVRQENISSTGEAKDSIPSNKEGKDSIPSNKEGKESIPSNKESDLTQLSSKERDLAQQGCMFELEWYKMICHEKGDAYYDSFKNRNDYSKNNSLRVTLNDFWDEIIGIWNSPSLPSDFQSRNKWINVGTAYRKLVEPLDIAQHYSTSKDSDNYLDERPARYKVLEQWLEHRKANRSSRDQRSRRKLPFLTRDSCFWARVEEALKDLKEGAEKKKESLENFEKYVTEMISDCKISSDVLLEGSSFMKWWRDYKEHQTSEWKLKSPLYKLESPFWKP